MARVTGVRRMDSTWGAQTVARASVRPCMCLTHGNIAGQGWLNWLFNCGNALLSHRCQIHQQFAQQLHSTHNMMSESASQHSTARSTSSLPSSCAAHQRDILVLLKLLKQLRSGSKAGNCHTHAQQLRNMAQYSTAWHRVTQHMAQQAQPSPAAVQHSRDPIPLFILNLLSSGS